MGNLWLFGGFGYSSTSSNTLNDLWRYELPQCGIDEDCDEAKVCRQQQCFGTCSTDSDCADGLLCNGVETCIGGLCLAGPWPCQAGQYCDEQGGRCIECVGSADCDDGSFCNGLEICSVGSCVAGSSPCEGATPFCDETYDRCLECLNDSQCDDFCLNNVCVECRNNADCDDGVYCNGVETCVGGDCVGTSPCLEGEVCDEALGCAACRGDSDCGGGDSCKESSGVCVECYADRDCSAGYSCLYGICALPAYAQWTWMGGSNTTGQVGVYGKKGMPGAANVPGARYRSISWTDSDGNFWLFGGYGYGNTSTGGRLNDLWRYDAFNNKWTWMGGANTTYQVGIYGTKGVPDAANVPGAREDSISWTDGDGNFWLFGGYGYGSTASYGQLNDLWSYDPATKLWTWVSGAKTRNQPGVYGTKGVPNAANVPGARYRQHFLDRQHWQSVAVRGQRLRQHHFLWPPERPVAL